MKQITFEYVPEFEMDTAIFDDKRMFYNAYGRKKQVSAGSESYAKLIDGEVYHAHSTYSANAQPFTHRTTGELFIGDCEQPEKRGRYTFCGYDYTVISTTNDKLGAIAMKHMRSLVDSIKINGAALSTETDGESKNGQTLLIDHVTQRVYSLRRSYNPEGVTHDGVDFREMWQGVPKEKERETRNLYVTRPGGLTYATQYIRVTELQRHDTVYKDTVAACLAWFRFEGKTVNEHHNEAIKAAKGTGRIEPGIYVPVPAADITAKGFAGLTDYERARVATVNAGKAAPRKLYNFYMLGFDNAGFFEEVNAKINK